jgi:hypothetical protein
MVGFGLQFAATLQTCVEAVMEMASRCEVYTRLASLWRRLELGREGQMPAKSFGVHVLRIFSLRWSTK